jgi:hypothetical protein
MDQMRVELYQLKAEDLNCRLATAAARHGFAATAQILPNGTVQFEAKTYGEDEREINPSTSVRSHCYPP